MSVCFCCKANFKKERLQSAPTCINGERICLRCAREIEHRDKSTTTRKIVWYGTRKGRRNLLDNTKTISTPIFAEYK